MARTERIPEMTRSERPILALGLLAFCTGVIVLMLALLLGFHIGSSVNADINTAKGQLIAVPAAIALVTGVVTLSGRRRHWAFAVGWVGVAAAAVAVLLTVVVPGGG